MELTQDYTFIGRSNPVGCAAGWQYYLLAYAKAEGAGMTVLLRLACTSDATFYGYRTTGFVKVNGENIWQWESALPGADWSSSAAITVDGVRYLRHTDLGTCHAPAAAAYSVEAAWARVESVEPVPKWLPYYKTYANLSALCQAPGGGAELLEVGTAVVGASSYVRYSSGGDKAVLRFALGDWSQDVQVPPSGTFTAPLPVAAAHQFPQAVTATGTVTLLSYQGNTLLGSATEAVTMGLSAAEPTVEITSLAPVQQLPEGFGDLYIQGKSRLSAQLRSAGKLGAWIVSEGFLVEGVRYPAGGVSQLLHTPGTVTVTAYAVDSRGLESRQQREIRVWDYTRPTVELHEACRCDEAGSGVDGGGWLRLRVTGSAAVLDGRNGYALWWRWQPMDGSHSEKMSLGTAFDGVLGGSFEPQTGYTVQVGIRDGLGEETCTTVQLPTEAICAHRGRDFLALGMYSRQGGLECGWPARFYGQVYVGDQTLEQYIRSIIGG